MIQRFYTKAGKSPFATVDYRIVDADNGRRYTVPVTWSVDDVDDFIQHVFYPHPVSDVALSNADTDDFETDIRDVIDRVVLGISQSLATAGFLDTDTLNVFKDELTYVLLHQRITFETAIWASMGLVEKYQLGYERKIELMNTISSLGHDISLKEKPITSICVSPDDKRPHLLDVIRLQTRAQILKNKQAKKENRPLSVLLPLEHVDSLNVIAAQKQSDVDTVTRDMGLRVLQDMSDALIDACDRDSLRGFDPTWNTDLSRMIDVAKSAGLTDAVIQSILQRAEMGDEYIDWGLSDDIADTEGFLTTLSITDDFFETAVTGHGFQMVDGGKPDRHIQSSDVLTKIADAIWSSGQPNILFRDHVWKNTAFGTDTPVGISARGGLIAPVGIFGAPVATIDLKNYQTSHVTGLDVDAFAQSIVLATFALEGVLLQIEKQTETTDPWRNMLLGLSGLGDYLMAQGFAYDSPQGRGLLGVITALFTGYGLKTSAWMARVQKPFSNYKTIEKNYVSDIKQKMALLSTGMGRGFGVGQVSVQKDLSAISSHPLLSVAQELWHDLYAMGKENGFRHAHISGFEDGALSPVFSTVLLQEKGHFIHPSVMKGLIALGYTPPQMDDIYAYVMGSGTLFDAPKINHKTLKAKGFTTEKMTRIETALQSVQDLRDAFYDVDTKQNGEDVLLAWGFTHDDIEDAHLFACGAMTIEGAPHIHPNHLSVFDTAQKTRQPNQLRFVTPDAEVKMQSTIETFLSGATRHTLYVDYDTDIDTIEKLILLAWECGVKLFQCRRVASSLLSLVVPRGMLVSHTGSGNVLGTESAQTPVADVIPPKKHHKAS